jgi:hypothetical protein
VLSLLREAGFPASEAAQVASYLLQAVITLVTAGPGPSGAPEGAEREAAIRMQRALPGVLDPERFPNVIASADARRAAPWTIS